MHGGCNFILPNELGSLNGASTVQRAMLRQHQNLTCRLQLLKSRSVGNRTQHNPNSSNIPLGLALCIPLASLPLEKKQPASPEGSAAGAVQASLQGSAATLRLTQAATAAKEKLQKNSFSGRKCCPPGECHACIGCTPSRQEFGTPACAPDVKTIVTF